MSLNPGFRAGRKQARFSVRLDDEPGIVRELAVVAFFVPEVADSLDESSEVKVRLGSEGHQRIRFDFHKHGEEGRDVPGSVEATPPLLARFTGPAETTNLGKNFNRTSRTVEITIPASAKVGFGRGVVTLRWGDGQSWSREVEWQVIPRLVASPSGLSLQPRGPNTRSIVLRSLDRPFRVLGVDGELLIPGLVLPEGASIQHSLTLNLDPTRVAGGSLTGLRIATDDPDQPIVEVSVLILPTDQGGRP